MRAAQVETLTGPPDLIVNDMPEPTPGPDDVLVEVHSVGVSFPDLLLSRGEYQMKPEPPFNLGVDFAGVVLDPGSSDFVDRASASPASPAGATPPSGSPRRRPGPSRCPTSRRSTRARRCR